jgi:large subunit ribosomal protein L25
MAGKNDNLTLEALRRTEFGKGAARRTRREGRTPATIHTRGDAPVHVALPAHATSLALRHANALLTIVLPGADQQLAIAREVQRHPFRDYIEHVDLQAVRAGEKLEVEVPLRIEGEPQTGIAILDIQTLRVLAEATSLPESLTIDVSALSDGETIHAGQVALPEGVTLVGDADQIVLTIAMPRSEIEEVAEVEEEEAEADAPQED